MQYIKTIPRTSENINTGFSDLKPLVVLEKLVHLVYVCRWPETNLGNFGGKTVGEIVGVFSEV